MNANLKKISSSGTKARKVTEVMGKGIARYRLIVAN